MTTVRAAARKLAREHIEDDEYCWAVYWIPHETEIKLINVTDAVEPSGEVLPFRFASDPPEIPHKCLTILLHPDDWKRRAALEWPPSLNVSLVELLVDRGELEDDYLAANAFRSILKVISRIQKHVEEGRPEAAIKLCKQVLEEP